MHQNTPTRYLTALLIVAAMATLAGTSGCIVVAAGAGAGAVAYVRGDLEATLEATLDRSARAVNRAIEQLKFAKISEKSDALQAIVVARNAADKKIEIRLEKASDALTKIKIRVAIFGDEALSMTILDKVKANL